MTGQRGKIQLQDESRNVAGTSASTASGSQLTRGQKADNHGLNLARKLLNIGSKAVKDGVQYGNMVYQKKLEEDRFKAQNDSLSGVMPEDPSDQNAKIAASLLDTQNAATDHNRRAQEKAKNWTGSREEWDEWAANDFKMSQDAILLKYGEGMDEEGRAGILKNMTNAYGEQTVQIQAAYTSGQLDKEHKQRTLTFSDNMLTKIENLQTPEQINAAMGAVMSTNAELLQLTSVEAESALISAALTQAKTGDTRLIDFAKTYRGKDTNGEERETTLFSRSSDLINGERAAKQYNYNEDAVTSGNYLESLKKDFYGGVISRKAAEERISKMNEEAGGAFMTPRQEEEFFRTGRRLAKQSGEKKSYSTTHNPFEVGYVPFSLRNGDKKAQTVAASAWVDRLSQHAENIIESRGITDEAAKQEIRSSFQVQAGRYLVADNVEHKPWTNMFESFTNQSLNVSDPDAKFPAGTMDIYKLWSSLPTAAQGLHSTDATQDMMDNFGYYLSTSDSEVEAFSKMQNAKGHKPVSGDPRNKKLFKEVQSAISDSLNGDIASLWTNETQEGEQYRVESQVYFDTMRRIQGGARPELAIQRATDKFVENNYRTLDGNYIEMRPQALAQAMGVAVGDDLAKTLEYYKQDNEVEFLNKSSGTPIDEIGFKVDQSQGTFTMINTNTQGSITSPLPLTEIKRGRDDANYLKEAKKVREALIEEANYPAGLAQTQIDSIVRGRGDEDGAYTEEEAAYLQAANEKRDALLSKVELAYPLDEEGEVKLEYARREGRGFDQRENKPEDDKRFDKTIQNVENSIRAGWSASDGTWTPDDSPELGNPTIAYGHKLSDVEMQTGRIEVGQDTYRFRKGESEITENVALLIYDQQMKEAEDALIRNWTGYEQLKPEYQYVLKNIQFNAGDAKPSIWKDLNAAMIAGDDAAVKEEMLTTFTEGTDESTREALTNRRDQVYDSIFNN